MFHTTLDRLVLAQLGVSAFLLGGALVFQYGFGLAPCEMCIWQRIPHALVLGLGGAAYFIKRVPRKAVSLMMSVLLSISAALGVFHAGVEYGFWEGITTCTAQPVTIQSVEDLAASLAAVPLVRCDVVPWSLFGISMAGYNAVLSAGGALLGLVALRVQEHTS